MKKNAEVGGGDRSERRSTTTKCDFPATAAVGDDKILSHDEDGEGDDNNKNEVVVLGSAGFDIYLLLCVT